jgi:hypothetical protein
MKKGTLTTNILLVRGAVVYKVRNKTTEEILLFLTPHGKRGFWGRRRQAEDDRITGRSQGFLAVGVCARRNC